jgi:EAL domain-containing protein (putative c-di-GMP-specific phosphodiesterase class I)
VMSTVAQLPLAASAAGILGGDPAQTVKSPVCYVVDHEVGTRQVVTSVLCGMNIASEHFDSLSAMLERCGIVHPDLMIIDVTVSSGEARRYAELLAAANIGCPIRIMSGLNGLLTEELRRSWERSGLKNLSVIAKPLRQQAIKTAASNLIRRSPEKPKIGVVEAIEKGWFELWYQPRIDLNSKTLAGAEGLFRARHPKFGVFPADELLEGATEADLLNLTTRVLGRALGDWKSFRDLGVPIELSINVPVCALKRLSLFSIFWEQGPGTSDWPGITLELNEDDVIPNMAFAFSAIKELQKHKVGLAIDSFGLSYEELSRHKELPFSTIKIDRSFICNCDIDPLNAGLCGTIIDFAHRNRATVVAEGIETAGELKALRNMGCDYGQGYLLARPMSKADLLAILPQRSPKVVAAGRSRPQLTSTAR